MKFNADKNYLDYPGCYYMNITVHSVEIKYAKYEWKTLWKKMD